MEPDGGEWMPNGRLVGGSGLRAATFGPAHQEHKRHEAYDRHGHERNDVNVGQSGSLDADAAVQNGVSLGVCLIGRDPLAGEGICESRDTLGTEGRLQWREPRDKHGAAGSGG